MAENTSTFDSFRERLTETLAEWGSEVSSLLAELERLQDQLEQRRAAAESRDEELESARRRIEEQQQLVESLRGEAGDAGPLREEVREKDLELERLGSELESKRELIRALRRDAERVDRFKSDAREKESEVEKLNGRCRDLAQENESLKADNENLRASAESESEDVRAELENVRADAERVDALEASLDEKRKIIGTLENSMNRQSETITELQRKSDAWKSKYESLKDGPASTSVELPALTSAAIEERLAGTEAGAGDQTIAIDMREPLRQARLRANDGRGKG